jgi:hypothetical protein
MEPLPRTHCYIRRAGVIETDLATELVLLDPATQQMFSLNPTGRFIWQSLGALTVGEIVERVVAAFEVQPDVAATDTRTLLEQLSAAGLVERA